MRHRGFTLIEMLVTLALLGILASVIIPIAQLNNKVSREEELRRALRDIRTAIDRYHEAARDGRIAVSFGSPGYPPDLQTLVDGVRDAGSPAGRKLYFLRRIPRDPLSPTSTEAEAESWGIRSYASAPDAPMPGTDVYDVYSLSPEIGSNSIPYREW